MRQFKISKQITLRESLSLEKYLLEVNKLALVTATHEVVLADRIRLGDTQALDELVSANLRFVISVAKQYQNQGLTLGDLINEGNLGLIKAAKRFDTTRGFKFISYAVWWIRQSILAGIQDSARLVRVPSNRNTYLNRLKLAQDELEQEHNREPTNEELADVLEMTFDEIRELQQLVGRAVSLDAPCLDSDTSMLDGLCDEDGVAPDVALEAAALPGQLRRALQVLPVREAQILAMQYGLDGTPPRELSDIGLTLGLSRERVRQMREKALGRLRVAPVTNLLREYLS